MIDTTTGDHLCVLVHGLWGTPDHLKQLVAGLKAKHDAESFHILVPHTNAQYLTYDGIDLGGERVAKETEEELERLKKDGRTVKKISFVGYSLGGLVARYCIGLLYSRGIFDTVQPVNFTAFASPFLGVRTPHRGYTSGFFNALGGRTLSASGQQLFLIDQFRDTGRPLLSILTDSNSIFIKALSLFKNRVLYANIINDRSAPWFTTGISSTDPYEDISLVDLHPLKDYGPTILDPENPVTAKAPQNLTMFEQIQTTASNAVSSLPLMAVVTVLAPIGIVGFLANSGYQTVQSMRRMRLHNEDSNLGFSTYRVPPLLEDMAKEVASSIPAEKLDTSTTDAREEQVTAAVQAAEAEDQNKTSSPTSSSSTISFNEKQPILSLPADVSPDIKAETSPSPSSASESGPFKTLALATSQFEMITNLNALGWRKYGVHITKVRHSHAAIIVRIEKEGYQEGRTVIKHWIEEEFEI